MAANTSHVEEKQRTSQQFNKYPSSTTLDTILSRHMRGFFLKSGGKEQPESVKPACQDEKERD